jgi:hypothetical protein
MSTATFPLAEIRTLVGELSLDEEELLESLPKPMLEVVGLFVARAIQDQMQREHARNEQKMAEIEAEVRRQFQERLHEMWRYGDLAQVGVLLDEEREDEAAIDELTEHETYDGELQSLNAIARILTRRKGNTPSRDDIIADARRRFGYTQREARQMLFDAEQSGHFVYGSGFVGPIPESVGEGIDRRMRRFVYEDQVRRSFSSAKAGRGEH